MDNLISERLLHGGDYNPDQWLEYPEILKEDIRLMKEAGVNCVTLGVFAWSRLEPSEGNFDFDWLEKIMDDLYANGISTILATPTGAMPRWLTDHYAEVNKMEPNGLRRIHGQRHNFCPSSPKMRERMHAIDTALSRRFGRHPGLIAWHLSNEYGGAGKISACHCPHCQENFRTWLKKRYGTVENLNRAWWTDFWGNRICDFSEIHGPTELGEHSLHGLKLDWQRYVSDQMQDFCEAEIKAVRRFSDAPVTTNFMGAFKPLNYFRWAKSLDFISHDCYPAWHTAENEIDVAVEAAFHYTLMRSLKRRPFLLMESVPSTTNWFPRCSLKRPGMHALSSLQAVACGSNSVQYFQWRKSRGASEKYHGAVVDHKNGSDTRVFRDVADLGRRLENLSEQVVRTCNRPRAALVFDWENWWAVEDAQAVVNHRSYLKMVLPWFKGFWEKGVDVDIVDMDGSLEGYRLVVAPVNYMYRAGYAERVKTFVRRGGTYVTTYWSGEVDDADLCFLGQHPLRDLLGIRTEEIDVRPERTENAVLWDGERYRIRDLCALVHAETAEVLASYESDFYAGMPALTRNRFGEGAAYFVAAECGRDFIRALYDRLTESLDIGCALSAALPGGVSVSERRDDASSLWFVQNFNAKRVCLFLSEGWQDAESHDAVRGAVELTPYQCMVLEKQVSSE